MPLLDIILDVGGMRELKEDDELIILRGDNNRKFVFTCIL